NGLGRLLQRQPVVQGQYHGLRLPKLLQRLRPSKLRIPVQRDR
ncbi:MAG: hypothetical protein RIS44_2139, partial [Pseudomonadota bacterium]